jgi:hypothetical protein
LESPTLALAPINRLQPPAITVDVRGNNKAGNRRSLTSMVYVLKIRRSASKKSLAVYALLFIAELCCFFEGPPIALFRVVNRNVCKLPAMPARCAAYRDEQSAIWKRCGCAMAVPEVIHAPYNFTSCLRHSS